MTNHKKTCKWFEVCPLKRFYEQGKLVEEKIDIIALLQNVQM